MTKPSRIIKFVHLLLIVIYGSIHLPAQVTIGSGNTPERYSILQIEGTTGGLRLPRYNTEQRNKLNDALRNATSEQNTILVIYNTTTNIIEYWEPSADNNNGDWLSLKGNNAILNYGNAIYSDANDNDAIKLGGDLNRNTSINIVDNQLDFSYTKDGSFTISSAEITGNTQRSIFTAKSDKIGIGTSTPDINNEAKMVVKAMPGEKAFRLEDGTQKEGYVLTSDTTGNASWTPIRDEIIVKHAMLLPDVQIGGVFNTQIPISQPLKLPPGKWMIFAKCLFNGYSTTGKVNTSSLNIWVRLKKESAKTPTINGVGMIPQNRSGNYYTTIQMNYILDIEEEANYLLYASSASVNNNLKTMAELELQNVRYGGTYFYAIRLSKGN